MFSKNKALNRSIFISALGHLLCIFFILPTISPDSARNYNTELSFIGSILDRVSVAKEKDLLLEELTNTEKNRIVDEQIAFNEPKELSRVTLEPLNKDFASDQATKKEDIVIIPRKNAKEKDKIRITINDMSIRGEAENRVLLYKPDVSGLVLPIFYFESDCTVSLKFKISKHGFVEQPECLVSSGSFYVDRLAMLYIRKWQFVPYYNGISDFQEGIVRLNFTNRPLLW